MVDKYNTIFKSKKGEKVVALQKFKDGFIVCTTHQIVQIYRDKRNKIKGLKP